MAKNNEGVGVKFTTMDGAALPKSESLFHLRDAPIIARTGNKVAYINFTNKYSIGE